MRIEYRNAFDAWEEFRELVTTHIITSHAKKVCEVGAGANPFLSEEFVSSNGIEYHLVDISVEEIAKAHTNYHVHIADFSKPANLVTGQFDVVFCQMTLEHIENPKVFFDNIRRTLSNAGTCALFFANKTALPMFINSFLPDGISQRLLKLVQPFRKSEHHGKFKAFYRWCFGPTPANIVRFQRAGFEIVLYRGYFGHSYYARIPVLRSLERTKVKTMLKHPIPQLSSYSHVLLKNTEELFSLLA